MADLDPYTCVEIEDEFDADGRLCGRCPVRGEIRAPIVLGQLAAWRRASRPAFGLPATSSAPVSTAAGSGASRSGVRRTKLGGEERTVDDLVHGLADLLRPLGGSATAREILDQLARSGDDFPALRAALRDLFPRIERGQLPRPIQLAGRLRSHRGRVVRGACIDRTSRTYQGVHWTVRKVA